MLLVLLCTNIRVHQYWNQMFLVAKLANLETILSLHGSHSEESQTYAQRFYTVAQMCIKT